MRGTGRWLVAAVVFVAALEVCIRIEDRVRWGADLLGPYSHDLLSATDSIGRRNRPSTTFEKWTVNRYGFRGPEIDVAKPVGKTRVAVLGASETFGLYESAGMEFPTQMAELLNEAQPRGYQVVNTAIPGASPPHLRDYYERWVSRFAPDIVVVYPAPAFYLDDRPPRLPETRPRPRDPVEEHRWDLRLVARSEAKLKQFLPPSLQTWLKAWSIRRTVASRPEGWVYDTVPEDRLQLYRQDLTALVEAIQASGARVVLGTHANRFQRPLTEEEREQLVGWRRFIPRAGGEVLIDWEDAANEVVRDVARQMGLPLADLARTVPKGPEFFADFSHFTDRGATVAAETFVRTLLRTDLVEAGMGAG